MATCLCFFVTWLKETNSFVICMNIIFYLPIFNIIPRDVTEGIKCKTSNEK
jgi:hypothetical protein